MKETFKHYETVSELLAKFGMKITEKEFKKIQLKQYEKGFAKYGKTLNEQPNDAYNWTQMSVEELIDFCCYVEKNKIANPEKNKTYTFDDIWLIHDNYSDDKKDTLRKVMLSNTKIPLTLIELMGFEEVEGKFDTYIKVKY